MGESSNAKKQLVAGVDGFDDDLQQRGGDGLVVASEGREEEIIGPEVGSDTDGPPPGGSGAAACREGHSEKQRCQPNTRPGLQRSGQGRDPRHPFGRHPDIEHFRSSLW